MSGLVSSPILTLALLTNYGGRLTLCNKVLQVLMFAFVTLFVATAKNTIGAFAKASLSVGLRVIVEDLTAAFGAWTSKCS